MLPPITIIVPLYVLFNGLKLTDTRTSLIISYLTFTIPLSIWMMIGFFADVPQELEELAMIDGCTRLQALFRVSLPHRGARAGRHRHPGLLILLE